MKTVETISHRCGHVEIRLNDFDRRNALGLSMFDELDRSLEQMASRQDCSILTLTGAGPVFCAGFDLAAAVEHPVLMAEFISRLSTINRVLRRLPQVVVAVVQGAAIAGGCALLGACDFVVVAPDARLGYPVHRIGVSPAVTIPTLRNRMSPGAIRSLLMSGELVDGRTAVQIGLATHVAQSNDALDDEARRLVETLAAKGPRALRVTKAWLNELDGSLDDAPFEATVRGSTHLAGETEAVTLLRDFWSRRKS